jgi:hypothetical protein
MFSFKRYMTNVYWGEYLIKARQFELDEAKKNLAEYKAFWVRFINYCHTGK